MELFKHLLLNKRKRHTTKQEGQGLVEYAIILIFVGIAVVAIVAVLEPSVRNVFSAFVRNAPVAPPSLVNYTPPPTYTITPTFDPNATATSPPPVPSATLPATATSTLVSTVPPTPSTTPSPSPTPVCVYGPYNVPANGSVRVQAENFSCGGPNVGFLDNNGGGSGTCTSYRTDVADREVDLESSSDDGTCNIGWINTGEWTRYSITAPQTLRYDFVLRVAALGSNGRVRVRVTNLLGTVQSAVYDVPDTGGWQNWTNLRISDSNLFLQTGTINTVEIFAERSGYNFNYFDVSGFVPTPTPTIPPTATPTQTPTNTPVPVILTFENRVSTGNDDAEETYSNGAMNRGSVDLDLGRSLVGFVIRGVTIPKNATITNAYIVFHARETDTQPTNLSIRGQSSDSANGFSNNARDISFRPQTTAAVSWTVPAWNQNSNYQSPNIKAIIQEVVNRNGWSSGNSMALIISGSGQRVAESYNGDRFNAPLLHIEYTVP